MAPAFAAIRLAGAALAFLAPGWLIGRVVRSPAPELTAFLGSAALLVLVVIACDALGLAIAPFTLACAWAAATAGLSGMALRRGDMDVRRPPPENDRAGRASWIWLVPPVLAAASVLARGLIDPLAGYDTFFRWDHLARLILAQESIRFYPPTGARDFELYGYCDGIPPLVSLLNWGIYAAAGGTDPRWISIRLAAEIFLLGAVTFRFGRRLWGSAGGLASVALLGSSALLLWAVAIEQETGLTALSLVALLYLLEEHRRAPAPTPAVWAGVAAGVGALTREYGLSFLLLGAGVLLIRRRGRDLGLFAAAGLAIALPWYLRNAFKTGNPLFPLLDSLFPTNPIYVEFMAETKRLWGFRTSPFEFRYIPLVIFALAGIPLLAALIGTVRLRARPGAVLAGMALIVGLWLWSAPMTAGGWAYSTRVLSPLAVLASVLGGWIGTLSRRLQGVAAGVLLLLSADAARRSWLLPDFPFASPLSPSLSEWSALRSAAAGQSLDTVWPVFIKAAAGQAIATPNADHQAQIARLGGRGVPFFSPGFAAAFDPQSDLPRAAERLRAEQVRFVVLEPNNPITTGVVKRYRALRELQEGFVPVARLRGIAVYDLYFLTPFHAPSK